MNGRLRVVRLQLSGHRHQKCGNHRGEETRLSSESEFVMHKDHRTYKGEQCVDIVRDVLKDIFIMLDQVLLDGPPAFGGWRRVGLWLRLRQNKNGWMVGHSYRSIGRGLRH